MFKVTAIDIDTSHPVEFAKIMKKGARGAYTGVYNTGIRSDNYVRKFMSDFDIEREYTCIEEAVENSDIGFIHSCNWDKHLELARPFIEAGKPVFIDKPIVGNMKDCLELKKLVDSGALILGGSSFRYCREFRDFMKKPVSERGEILTLYGSIGMDLFNYGIHIIESFGAFIPKGAVSVRCIATGSRDLYQVKYNNGTVGIYQICPGMWRPTIVLATTTKGSFFIKPDVKYLYQDLLNYIFDVLEGKRESVAPEYLLKSVEIALAGKISKENAFEKVKLRELTEYMPGYDGNQFEKEYAANLVNK